MTNAFAAPTKHNTFVRATKNGFQAVCGAGDFVSDEVTQGEAKTMCTEHAADHEHGRDDAATARPVAVVEGELVLADGTRGFDASVEADAIETAVSAAAPHVNIAVEIDPTDYTGDEDDTYRGTWQVIATENGYIVVEEFIDARTSRSKVIETVLASIADNA